ncbi:MAG TPA: glutamate 5-kinase [Thermoguttaceae bacterium]|nr:glutamate 5-kinase [Thermoguttaceae bacterium]
MTDLLRQEIATAATTLVVKVGTRVLTGADGLLNDARIAQLGEELNQVVQTGRRVALVSSGAVGAGMGRLGMTRRPTDLAQLQAVAAIGQSALVEAYERSFRAHGRHAAQILVTADDVDDRVRYLNARNTLLTLLELGAIPVINENDTLSVDELRTTFGDNDRLAAIVTNLIRAPLLVLLSDVEGLYDGPPDEPGAKIIHTITHLEASVLGLVRDKTGGLGKGGMASKLEAARLATSAGENVIIASGRAPGVLAKILAGEEVGTLITAQGQSVASRKRWIGFTVQPRGHLVLDEGACRAVRERGRSLLPIGVLDATGSFDKGDVVAMHGADRVEFARGLTNYSFDEVQRIKGLRTGQIAGALGCHPYDEIIHRDNMVVTR